jgi:hypothetical protein
MAMTSPTDDPQGREPFRAAPAGEPSYGGPAQTHDDAPTSELVTATVGDRCANCGAPLASDQRYCVECGERRGKPRFSVGNAGAPAAAASPRRRRRLFPQTSAGGTLILGVGVLLLAMGVGVEIGNSTSSNGNTAAAKAPAAQIITVNGGGPAAAAATSTTGSTKKVKAVKAKPVTKKVAAKATAAANKVLGSGSNNLASPTVKQGGACAHGAGCQNGKFTGTFFGP